MDSFFYEVRPCMDVDGSVVGCEPSEAMYWGVYERSGPEDDEVWAADFLRKDDAEAYAETMAASHL